MRTLMLALLLAGCGSSGGSGGGGDQSQQATSTATATATGTTDQAALDRLISSVRSSVPCTYMADQNENEIQALQAHKPTSNADGDSIYTMTGPNYNYQFNFDKAGLLTWVFGFYGPEAVTQILHVKCGGKFQVTTDILKDG